MKTACCVWSIDPCGCAVERIDRALRVCCIARPDVAAGLADHARTDRIEFDVAVAAQQVIVGLHRAGLEAAFPKRAGAAVAIVDVADVATPQRSTLALTKPVAAGVSSRCTGWVINSQASRFNS